MHPTRSSLNCEPRLQGHNPHHQLETIVSVLGLPPEEQLSFVTHPAARKAIMSRANVKPKDLESYFPADASPLALDLLRRMVSAFRSNTYASTLALSQLVFFHVSAYALATELLRELQLEKYCLCLLRSRVRLDRTLGSRRGEI